MESPGIELDVHAKARESSWFSLYRRWIWVYRVLGVGALCASVLSASDKVAGAWAPYYAVAASLFIAVLGFVNPQKRASAYGRAFRGLHVARLGVRHKGLPPATIIDAIAAGEGAIGESDPAEMPQLPPGR